MHPVLKYTKGSVIVFTTGEYSDYRVTAFLVAIQDLDLPALAQQMTAGKYRGDDDADVNDFAGWLIANGHAMPVDHSLVHLGDYGWGDEFGIKLPDEPEETSDAS